MRCVPSQGNSTSGAFIIILFDVFLSQNDLKKKNNNLVFKIFRALEQHRLFSCSRTRSGSVSMEAFWLVYIVILDKRCRGAVVTLAVLSGYVRLHFRANGGLLEPDPPQETFSLVIWFLCCLLALLLNET